MKKGIYKRNLLVPFLKIISDSISIVAANLLAYYLRFFSPLTTIFPVTKGIPPFDEYLYFTLFNVIIIIILFSNFRSYRSRFFSTFSEDISVILKVSFLSILFSMSFAFLNRDFSYSRLVFALVFINSIILLLSTRYLFHKIKYYFLNKGYNILRVVLIGSPKILPTIYDRLKENNIYKFDFRGYVANSKIELPINYLGSTEEIGTIIDLESYDGIILAYDSAEHFQILNILKSTEGKNTELFYVPDILDLLTSHINVLEINGTPLFQFKSFTLSGWQGFLKRAFDIFVSIFGLCILSPLFLIISILVKMTSKGPVFYLQKRVSIDGTEFTMIKFRSMRVDAESETGPVWATSDDSRTTILGKILRRTSLDELPQLWNIIKGDMSIVGPRPERQHFIDQFKEEIPHYLERQRLRSGVTGWAQVNGLRGQSPISERTKYDLYYIENWSLWFDIKIIILTFIAIFKGENAY